MKVKLVSHSNYNGPLGDVEFVNSISKEDIENHFIRRYAQIGFTVEAIKEVDTDKFALEAKIEELQEEIKKLKKKKE